MTTYHVNAAFADKLPGDKIAAGDLSDTDAAYLLAAGVIVAETVTTTVKRSKKESTETE